MQTEKTRIQFQPSFALSDVIAIIRSISEAANTRTKLNLKSRREILLRSVASFIHSDAWFWFTSQSQECLRIGFSGKAIESDCHVRTGVHGSSSLDRSSILGDFAEDIIDGVDFSDSERNYIASLWGQESSIMQLLSGIRFALNCGQYHAFQIPKNDQSIRTSLDDFLPNASFETPNRWCFDNDVNMRDFGWELFVAFPMENGNFGLIGFRRPLEQLEFTERDRIVVQNVFQELDWLHQSQCDCESEKQLRQLSPRKQQVAQLLLEGESTKSIATKLELSYYTVGDYIKEIYKHFSVNSRGELLTKFI